MKQNKLIVCYIELLRSGVYLEGVDFREVDLGGVDFREVDLGEVDLGEVDLGGGLIWEGG
jgi:uncharacterized protein YjbI with pentapeptide repeats